MSDDMQSQNGRQRLVGIGCCDLGPSPGTYFKRFSTLEYQQSFFSLPKSATLTKLRNRAPEGFSFILRAWQLITHEASSAGYRRLANPLPAPEEQYGHFQLTEGVLEAWRQTRSSAEALGARGILFETPPAFTPSPGNRLQLTRFFEQIERGDQLLIWQPGGLWAEADVAALCKDQRLLPALDPLTAETLPDTEQIYFKLAGFGQTQGFSDTTLLKVIQQARSFDQAYCLFNSLNMHRDATRALTLLSEALD